ncbi:FHA domain-containing protein [Microbulbifer donghaiensis]|uniref:FHA domain-containing protein n=1 Tax=Microbulbifer donghaiensis TaxID=494016 RepID=A0A1M4ZCK1_9GAMM|nr:FHA domain-containing protein [Microbulbifer donghaiensis]SHF15685.1 FHA domain-containing protein [Microbulbifer donghaiensis]
MALIIEELNRAHRVQARYRMKGDNFTLGRGYDNDVILEDIHADARHAVIRRAEDGSFYLRDLNSVNGTQLLGNARDKSVKFGEISERQVETGDLVQCGKTHLRLIDSDADMVEAVPLHSLENFFEGLSRPAGAIGLLLAVAVATVLISYLGYARKYEWTLIVNLLTGSLIGLLLYAGAWAFIGRVVRHETHFFTHLSIAAIGALVYTGWEWFSSLLNYNFALGKLVQIFDFLVLAAILPAMLWCACYLATNISRGWRWAVALVIPLGFLGIGLAEELVNMDEFTDIPEISTELKYDDLLLRKPVPMEQFIASAPALFDIPIEKTEDEQESDEGNTTPAKGDAESDTTETDS